MKSLLAIGLLLCATRASASMVEHVPLTYGEATVVYSPTAAVPVMLETVGGDAWCAFNGFMGQHAHAGFRLRKNEPLIVPAEHASEGIWCTPVSPYGRTEMLVVP
jgi:hypothetical protein